MLFKKVLLTGAGGKLGSFLRRELPAKLELLRSTDIAAMENPARNEEIAIADLGDPGQIDALVQGMDAIIHFGAVVEKDIPFEKIARVNIIGTEAIYAAAVRHRVRRVVFASSIHSVGYYRQNEIIDAKAPHRPDTYYGVTKAFGEALAQFYWDRHKIETVSIRIGTSEPEPVNRRQLRTWMSLPDMVRLIEAALSVPYVGHTVTFATSNNAESFWDNRFAAHLGFKPLDSADTYRSRIEAEDPNPDGAAHINKYQGGIWTQ